MTHGTTVSLVNTVISYADISGGLMVGPGPNQGPLVHLRLAGPLGVSLPALPCLEGTVDVQLYVPQDQVRVGLVGGGGGGGGDNGEVG